MRDREVEWVDRNWKPGVEVSIEQIQVVVNFEFSLPNVALSLGLIFGDFQEGQLFLYLNKCYSLQIHYKDIVFLNDL